MKRILKKSAAVLSLLIVLTSCGVRAGGGETGGLKIIATIFPVYDFTRAVAGGLADVSVLIGPGASIHSYDPSVYDIKRINECDAFICVGGESEAWTDRFDLSGKTVVRLIECVEPLEEDGGSGEYDGHIWTSPFNATLCVSAIAEALAEREPENADDYRKNAEDYNREIDAAERETAEIIAGAERKKIIVADRFALLYFTERFGLEYEAALSACGDRSGASVATVARLIETVKAEGIPYVYYAELSGGDIANAVSRETGAGTLLLHSCQNVTEEEFNRGETYVSLMRKNAENLKKGLN